MKKTMGHLIKYTSVFCMLLLGVCRADVLASVTEGKPGETVSGEYAVIVNTSMSQAESTGTLVFDNSGNSGGTAQAAAVMQPAEQIPDASAAVRTMSAQAVSYTKGTEKQISTSGGSGKTYVCIGEGAHCYVWMDKELKKDYDSAGKTDTVAKDIADVYENESYQALYDMCGGNIPYQDHSGRLSILLETLDGSSGVFKNDVGITAIHIHTPAASAYRAGEMSSRNGLLVHEGQHALFHYLAQPQSGQPYLWLNEGLSVAAMDYLWGGTDSSGWLDSLAGSAELRNGSPLVYQAYRGNTAQDYGMPYLFVRYLIDRAANGYAPMALFPSVYAHSAACSPDRYVQDVLGDGADFAELLTDFYTAVIALEPNGPYGFAGDSVVARKVQNYPLFLGSSGSAHTLAATAAIVIRLQDGSFRVPTDGGADVRYRIIGEGRGTAVPAAGDGSSAHPYQITSFSELNLLGNQPGACYILSDDITVPAGSIYLTPVYFGGVLDGNGHTVRGLSVPLTGKNSGTIQNLKIEAAFSGAYRDVQGVFAQYNTGTIENCTASGSVRASMSGQGTVTFPVFGGIVGQNEVSGTIRNCGSTASVSLALPAMKSWVGGIAGVNMGSVANCYSRQTITAAQEDRAQELFVGGIAGEIRNMGQLGGAITCCVHSGGMEITGGLQRVGQICGFANLSSGLQAKDRLVRCYVSQSCGFPAVGYPDGAMEEEGMALTDEQIKDESAYGGWSFGSEWKMGENGPVALEPSDIQELKVLDPPTFCYVGERLFTGGILQINGAATVPVNESMMSGLDSSRPGTSTVTVSYKGSRTQFTVEVREPRAGSVQELRVSSVKYNRYCVGDSFNPDGVCLIATIDGALKYIYSGFAYDKTGALTAADTSITFTYYGASCTYAKLSVEGIAASSLAVLSKMSRTSYTDGDALDLSGVSVRLTYNNGTESPLLGAADLKAYGIRAAKYVGGKYVPIALDQPLGTADNGAGIFLYATDILPGNYNAVSALAGKITIKTKLSMQDATLHMALGSQSWVTSHPVTGGSEQYQTAALTERLPQGVVRSSLPGENGTMCFAYRGTPTGAAGDYVSVYRITDVETAASIQVKVTIRVHLPNEAQFFRFDLRKSQNPGLSQDVEGVIEEHTVVLRVPAGTDVTALMPNVEYGAEMGTTLPQSFWNGSVHDFTDPVVYELTAPDGTTKKQYTVYIEFIDPETGEIVGGGTNPGEPGGNTGSGANPEEPGGNTGSGTNLGEPGGNTGGGANPGEPGGNTGSGTNPGEPGGNTGSGANPGSSGESVGGGTAQGAQVRLNATSVPLQLKKSSSALKISFQTPGDRVRMWKSSNPRIVSVNARTGKIKAKKIGKAKIVVTMESGAQASCLVKVQKKKVTTTGLTLPGRTISMERGQSHTISAVRTPVTATDKWKYKSSNKKVATVNAKGKIVARRQGKTIITVQSGRRKITLKVTVNEKKR